MVIKQGGIETDAVVTRVRENESTDEDGFSTALSNTYRIKHLPDKPNYVIRI